MNNERSTLMFELLLRTVSVKRMSCFCARVMRRL